MLVLFPILALSFLLSIFKSIWLTSISWWNSSPRIFKFSSVPVKNIASISTSLPWWFFMSNLTSSYSLKMLSYEWDKRSSALNWFLIIYYLTFSVSSICFSIGGIQIWSPLNALLSTIPICLLSWNSFLKQQKHEVRFPKILTGPIAALLIDSNSLTSSSSFLSLFLT